MSTIVAAVLVVFFALPIVALLLGYRPWDTTTSEDPRRNELEVESANAELVRELGNAEGRQRYVVALNSEGEPERSEVPTPTPLSPWLDETRTDRP